MGTATITDREEVNPGMAFSDNTATAYSGYSFFGWYRVTSDGNAVQAIAFVTNERTLESEVITAGTYYAFFSAGDGISFDSNGGSGTMDDMSFGDRTGSLTANAFTRDGYVFAGWATAADGDVVYYDRTPTSMVSGLSTTVSENVLYAVWAPYAYTSAIIWTVDGYMISGEDGSFLKTSEDYTVAKIYGENTASISATWLGILDESDTITSLYVELTHGHIYFDRGVIATFAAIGEDITFSIKPVSTSGSETFDVENNSGIVLLRYNITASYYDSGVKEFIHSLGGTATVTVLNTVGGNDVIYVGDDGDDPVVGAYDNDTITFTTYHFSLYEIIEEPEVPGGEDISMIVVVGALAGMAALAAGILTVRSRRI